MIRVGIAAAAVAALLAGCGGGGEHGHATLWVTQDEGRAVLVSAEVPAGETALQALDRKADITTRYSGKFVQSVNGLAGSIRKRHDWFYFVNGIEAPRGAQEYRLHDGDTLWWDYRDWGRVGQNVPVTVGAFPEPFVHGYGGKVRPTIVLGPKTPVVRRIAKLVHASSIVPAATSRVRGDVNTLTITPGGATRFSAELHGNAVHATFSGDPRRLLNAKV
ncbi:MAG: hypothetical protein QOF43_494, partial [Gaiellaceae bacterium]|nr:hypothetical protein [Gaiellaceae bacterium]